MSESFKLNDAFKKATLDQDKILPPEETVRRFKKKTRSINLDILEKTRRIDNGRLDIPVYFSICGKNAELATGTKKQMGKGGTPAQAEASAVMELGERFSLFTFRQNPENFISDTYRNVQERAISIEQIAKSVHDDSEDLEITREIFSDLPLRWARGYNLTQNKEVLIPFDWFFTINEFNGACAGNCAEEAICQGISEVVERHVSSMVSQKRLRVAALDPQSATDPIVVELLQKYERAGIKTYLSDFTLDMGIPSVGVLAYDPSTFPESSEIVWTAGTNPNPQKALSRALTEVAQLAGDFNSGSNYVASGLPKFKTIEDAEYITNASQKRQTSELPDISNNNIRVEIENCVAALSKKGMEVFIVNTLHPRLQVPAFYIVIPGARFRELAEGSSVNMFTAKLIAENQPPAVAVEKLLEIEKRLPGKYYVQFYLGSCFLALEQPATALKYFERALILNPTHQDIPSIYSYMGVCLKDLQKYQQALDILNTGLTFDTERPDIFNLMGFCFFKLKAHEKAIDCFQKVLEINPSSGIDYANIASNYRDMGEKEKAISYYRLALEFDPGLDFARTNLALLQSAK